MTDRDVPLEPARIRSAVALMPDDEATRVIEHCLSSGVSLEGLIAVLSEASRRAVAIEDLVCTPDQRWFAARRRNGLTFNELMLPSGEVSLERD